MIRLSGVAKSYGAVPVVEGLDLHVAEGAFCALIGASGSGKSTILRMINRLIEPDAGTIRFAGQDVTAFAPEALRRRMGYVIQSVGLFPHWTVAGNIAAVPAMLGWDRARIASRVEALLALLRLDPKLATAYPQALSGGQAQRVGVARALAADPDVLLMDEPFGALDPITRAALQGELTRIHRETGKTIVFVTHDMDEALLLATQVVVLEGGRVLQDATPVELLAHPTTDAVRDFVGRTDRGLKWLSLLPVSTRMRPGSAEGAPIAATQDCRAALSRMVTDAAGTVIGQVGLADLVRV
jgi:osmoprotectant transport system ATP-binding protein